MTHSSYRFTVTASAGTHSGSEHVYDFDQPLVLVGRRVGADIALPHASVGGIHLRIERDTDGVAVQVVHDGSPTLINGSRLDTGMRHRLDDGDTLLVADMFELVYQASSPTGASPVSREDTAEIARAMMRDLLAALGPENATPALRVAEGPHAGKLYSLAMDEDLIFGRGESCDAMIMDEDLSREHLRIRRDWSGVVAIDLGSKNGSYIGDERLSPGSPRPLRHGDRILVGSTALNFEAPGDDVVGFESTEPTGSLDESDIGGHEPDSPSVTATRSDIKHVQMQATPRPPSASAVPVVLALLVILAAITALVYVVGAG